MDEFYLANLAKLMKFVEKLKLVKTDVIMWYCDGFESFSLIAT